MSHTHEKQSDRHEQETASAVRIRVQTFRIPIIRDVAVIGVEAPVSRGAMEKILRIMTTEPFRGVDVHDNVIKSILVRERVIRRIGWPMVQRIVRRDVKPLMAKTEILALKLEIEVALSETFFSPKR